METIEAECTACGATGIYKGFAERAGVGVVCLECDGSGCRTLSYKPFTKRKARRDIETVQLSRGRLVATGIGPGGAAISYLDFAAGYMPTATEGGAP